ncbi:hypothetical protein BU23DRAFT_25296 [Bimuria novae-zelandiae CBS 107.79]|uniref:Uncharacterized protein n=1 Tax=Bimuria novae-zelandiae CBS 107.79 TaxID=1447943 RepID=A0A6A5UWH2_9PLEO|nr:hypothetical protein BU23DRAFT_25296 [Bimuria novae-zelandiae CBS 107.79]
MLILSRAQLLDQRDIDQWSTRVQRDIRHGQRSQGLASRYSNAMARQSRLHYELVQSVLLTPPERKRQQHLDRGIDYNSDDDGEDAILFQASSSGYVRARSTSRQRLRLSRHPTPALVTQTATQDSDSSSTTTPTPSQLVTIPFRSPSSQLSLQRQVLQQNLNAQPHMKSLDERDRESIVRRRELENEKLEIELEMLRSERAKKTSEH